MNPFHNRVRWLLIGWVFVISAVAYLDRVNISIAAKSIQQELKLDNIQLGWVFSAFVLGYALFQAPGGRLADRFGPRRIVAAGAVWWAVFTSITALAGPHLVWPLGVLLGSRFLLGIGEAVLYPASNLLVARWIPWSERGAATGIIFAGVGGGAALAPPLVTYILLHYGWRWSFWASAGLGVAAGAVWLLIARDRPEAHPWVSAAEAGYIRDGIPAATLKARPLPWRALLGSRDLRAVTLSYFTYGYAAYIFFTWFFLYLTNVRGLDLKSSSYYSMLPFLAMSTCSPFGGWLSDRVSRRWGRYVGRCWLGACGLLLSAGFMAFGIFAHDAATAAFLLAGGAGSLYLAQSSYWSVSADLAGPSAGSASGLMNMGAQLGSALTATATPMIAAHFGWPASFVVTAGLLVLGAAAWFWVDPNREIHLGRE